MTGLFDPFACKNLRLRNRIVMAPMTRSGSPGGIPGKAVGQYYRRRAEGEVGLIITEGVGIRRPGSLNDPGSPVLYGAAVENWARVVEEVHGASAPIAAQLWHVGARPREVFGTLPLGEPDSPSGLAWPGMEVGKSMTEATIADTIAAYAEAARNAVGAGFDAVEIHGAHGYLIDQFFWDATNLRTDRWGGATLADRTRFAVAVIRAVRDAIGPDTALLLRVSQDKSPDGSIRLANSPQEMESWLAPFVEAGVDILHCSGLRNWRAEFDGSDLNFAGWAKKLTGLPTISVGSVGLGTPGFDGSIPPAPIDDVLRRLDRGDYDLVAVGRALIADPTWPRKIKEGRLEDLRSFSAEALATLD
jgi:2,4-dienoyl-CoA reductase-like NADH-dependent reductase (Old Yellow Enzyme family)